MHQQPRLRWRSGDLCLPQLDCQLLLRPCATLNTTKPFDCRAIAASITLAGVSLSQLHCRGPGAGLKSSGLEASSWLATSLPAAAYCSRARRSTSLPWDWNLVRPRAETWISGLARRCTNDSVSSAAA